MNEPEPVEARPRRSRWMVWVLVVFVLQAGLLLWVSRKSPPRAGATRSMNLQHGMEGGAVEALAREDPELLTRPNPKGFSGVWLKTEKPAHEPRRWQPPDIELPYSSNSITKPLEAALTSNAPPRAVGFVKPPPRLTPVAGLPPLELRQSSRLEIVGALKGRPLVKSVPLIKVWKHPSLLKPSVVQVIVNANGAVATGALTGRSGLEKADRLALDIALQKVRFHPNTNAALATGDLVFHWHVDPASVTNLTVSPR